MSLIKLWRELPSARKVSVVINFEKSNSVVNDIPRIVNGELVFGHWSDRHQAVKGQEKIGDYVRCWQSASGHVLEFRSVSGEPHLPVKRFEGQTTHRYYGVIYTHAIIDTDNGKFSFPMNLVSGYVNVPQNQILPEMALEWAKKIEADKIASEKRDAEMTARRQAEAKSRAAYIESAKSYRPTYQERKWLKNFVVSDGRRAHQEVEKFLLAHGIHVYGWKDQIELIKSIWGQPECSDNNCDCGKCFNRHCAEIEAREM